MSKLPELSALAAAASAGRLLVFAGSGLSRAPPACLPDWRGFNASLLAPIRASALTLPELDAAGREAIAHLQVDDARALAFSEFLVGDFAGNDYLPVLQVLDGERPNAYHRVLAALARAGVLGAVVTTNFDTLIEQAFAEAAQELAVDDAADRPAGGLPLLKIHGTATHTATLKDTVSQKLRGLSLPLRARLAALYRDHHVLVVGFSGDDLAFGKDYLAFAAIDERGPGITWMLRPADGVPTESIALASPERLPDAAQEVVVRAGARGAVVEADLLGLCGRLGVVPPTPVGPDRAGPWARLGRARRGRPGAAAEAVQAQAAADQRARDWADAWFAKLGRSPVQCAVFCAAYLRSLGRQDGAAAICRHLETQIRPLAADDPMAAVNLALVLADDAKEHADGRRVQQLSQWSAEVADARVAAGDARRAPWARLRATAWSNLGLAARWDGDAARADVALGEALRSAEQADDAALVASLRLNEAYSAGKAGDLERQLALARQAGALMRRSASPHKAWAGLQLEALTLIRLAEYDAALSALRQAGALLKLDNDPARARMSVVFPEADILLHRGHIDPAWSMLQQSLDTLHSHPVLAAQLRFNRLEMFDFHRRLRPALRNEIDTLLASIDAGLVPGDGSAPPLPSARALRERRAALDGDGGPREPAGLRFAGPPRDPVDACRRRVKQLEYRADVALLPACFEALGRAAYEARDAARLLDAGMGLIAAAQRARDAASNQEGLRRVAIAAQLLGDFWQSIDAMQALLAASPSVDPTLRAALHRDLGTAFSRLDERDAMRREFDAMHALHGAADDADAALADGPSAVDAWLRVRAPDLAAAHIARLQPWLTRCRDAALKAFWQGVQARVDRLRKEPAPAPVGLPAALFLVIDATDEESLQAQRPWATSADELRALAMRGAAGGHAGLALSIVLQAQREALRQGDPLGVAHCLHDQAEIACMHRHWVVVREYGRWACDLRHRLGDVTGQVDSGAAWALGAYQLGMNQEAANAAQDALALALRGVRAPTRWVLTAWCVLAAVYHRVGRDDEHRRVRQDFLTHYPADAGQPLLQAVRAWFESGVT